MATCHVQFSGTRERLKSNQELLHILLDDAEDMLREQPDDECAPWLSAIVDKILENLVDHGQIEADGDYFENILERYPTWHSQIQHLQQEHQLLAGQLRDIAQRVGNEAASGGITRMPTAAEGLDWLVSKPSAPRDQAGAGGVRPRSGTR